MTTESAGELKLERFTKHVAQKFPPSPIIEGRPFTVNKEKFTVDVTSAIESAGRMKAAGPDKVFNEAIRLDPDLSSKFLTTLWTKCGQIM